MFQGNLANRMLLPHDSTKQCLAKDKKCNKLIHLLTRRENG